MSSIRAQATYAQAGAPDRTDRAESVTAALLHERYMAEVFRYVLRREGRSMRRRGREEHQPHLPGVRLRGQAQSSVPSRIPLYPMCS